jgi:hypothetical protein
MKKAPVFDEILKDYLYKVAHLETRENLAESLGISDDGERYRISFFGRQYTITENNILNTDGRNATHAVSVILCKYLLMCPEQPSEDFSLVTYKDFKDAAPYTGGFRNTSERPIALKFTNNIKELEKRCLELGGEHFATEVSCQLAMRFMALPKVPIILLYNDADDEFPAQATLLFEKNAASYLDMECLAMIASALAHYLIGKEDD